MNKGKVVQVIGPVVDVDFPEGELPPIYTALTINNEDTRTADDPVITGGALEILQCSVGGDLHLLVMSPAESGLVTDPQPSLGGQPFGIASNKPGVGLVRIFFKFFFGERSG